MAGVVEFEIAGVKYRANPMDARRQFHVATKLVGVATAFQGNPMSALSGLSVEDSDFVINECLRVTQRLEGTSWADVMAPTGIIMFEDIRLSLAALMQIVIPVVEANAQAFLSELPKDFVVNLIQRVVGKQSNSPA